MERRMVLQKAGLDGGVTSLAGQPVLASADGAGGTGELPAVAPGREFGAAYRPLRTDNAAVLLVDHQIALYTGVRDIPLAELKHNVVALAKAARVLGLPVVATTTSAQTMWGPTIPELVDALHGLEIIDRTTVNAWTEPRVVQAVEATGRRKLIIAGISLEVCAALPAISALAHGYESYVAVDACGTFSQAKREAGLLRMLQAGVVVSDYATLMVEALADNALANAAALYEAIDMPFAKLVGQFAAARSQRT